MYGLPSSTELHKRIAKSEFIKRFDISGKQRNTFDRDVSRIEIVGTISPRTMPALREGIKVKSLYVMEITLKRKEYDKRSIVLLAEKTPQNLLLVLLHEGEASIAVYYGGKLFSSRWQNAGDIQIIIDANDLDVVWQHIVAQAGNISVEEGNTLDTQISLDTRKALLSKKIEQLRRKSLKEQQPRKKADMHNEMLRLKEELKGLESRR